MGPDQWGNSDGRALYQNCHLDAFLDFIRIQQEQEMKVSQ